MGVNMVDKVAGLSLDVDVSTVQRAVKSLREFAGANDKAADSVHEFINETEVAKQKAKDHAQELQRQRKEYSLIEKAIDPTVAQMQKLRQASEQLDQLWQKGLVPDESFFRLGEILESQNAKLARSRAMLTEEGRAALEEAKAKEAAATKNKAFLASLQGQVDAIGKTHTELLELKAAQMGISNEAAPLIAQLKGQGQAMNAAGISAGQYKQAMRMLPAQITDVTVSLASGMPVWLVAIQQGGQIKDSFGGVVNTFKVLLANINPLKVAVGGFVGILGSLVMYAYNSKKELDKLKGSLNTDYGVSGDFATEAAKHIQFLADVTGKTTDEVKAAYISTKDGASDAITKLVDIGYTYDNAKEKVEGYRNASNFTLLNGEIDKHIQKVAELEKSWLDVALQKAKAMGGVLIGDVEGTEFAGKKNTRRGAGVDMVIDRAKESQKEFNNLILESNKAFAKRAEMLDKQNLSLNNVRQAQENLNKALEDQKYFAKSGNKELIKMSDENVKARQRELEQVKKLNAARDKPKKKKGGGMTRDERVSYGSDKSLYALEAQLELLKEHQDIGQKINSQRRELMVTEKMISQLEEKQKSGVITQGEKQLLNEQKLVVANQRRKADLAEQIQKMQKQNQLQENSLKFINQMNAAIESTKATSGMGDIAAARAQELAKIKADYVNNGGKEGDAQLQAMIDKQNEFYQTQDEKRANWLDGAKAAFANYGEAATNMYDNVGEIAGAALNGLTQQMTDFLTTGQANFADFAKNIIGMIVKMIAQMVIFNAISGMMGGKTWSFAGGFTPQSSPVPQESPIAPMLSRSGGDGVQTLAAAAGSVATSGFNASNAAPRAANQSGSGTMIDVSGMEVNVNNGGDPKGMQQGVEMLFKRMIREACSQGGEVYNYVQEKTGG